MNEIFSIGQWIWTEDEAPNQYVAFVKTTPLTPGGGPVRVRITASSHYELFINGDFVARGPVYGDPQWCQYDELTYTPNSRANSLQIVIVAHHSIGTRILALRPAPGGVLASFTGENLSVGTDSSWTSLPLPMWESPAAERGWALDYAEDYDAKREPEGWKDKIFPASVLDECRNAILVRAPETIWANYEARTTPYLLYDFVEPAHFSAFHASGEGVADMAQVSRYCDEEPLVPVDRDRAFDLASVNERIKGANAFTFDLGRECIGFYEFEIEAPKGLVIDLSGAELLREGRPWIERKGTRFSVRYRTRSGRQRFRPFGWSGFRYLHLVVRGERADEVIFHQVGCHQRTVALPPAKPFETADADLQRIFDLCRRTLQVGVQEHLIDCPTREQAQYWGDAAFIAQSLWRGFDEPSYLRFYLDCFIHVPFNEIGQISSVYPGNHATFLDYSLIPLLGQRFFKENTGRFYQTKETCDKALRLKAWYDARCDADGLVQSVAQETIGGVSLVNFLDHPGLGWHDFPHPGIDRDGISCPLNLFFYGYLTILSEMLEEEGRPESAAVRLQAERLGATIQATFFDGGVFHDALNAGRLSEGTSWQTNALAVYFGLIQGEAATRLMQTMLDQYDTICRCSPYFHFYFLFALRTTGLQREAIELIKKEWRPMLEGNATTTWEGFAGDEKDTLCHPWSTAPFLYLITNSDSKTTTGQQPKQ